MKDSWRSRSSFARTVRSLHRLAEESCARRVGSQLRARSLEASLFPFDHDTNAELQYYSNVQAHKKRQERDGARTQQEKIVRQTTRRVLTLDCIMVLRAAWRWVSPEDFANAQSSAVEWQRPNREMR